MLHIIRDYNIHLQGHQYQIMQVTIVANIIIMLLIRRDSAICLLTLFTFATVYDILQSQI